MKDKLLVKWQARLARMQGELARFGSMRARSLTQRDKYSAGKTRACWQLLSYTHKMRRRSRYVRLGPTELAQIKAVLTNLKRFRELVDRCVDLSIPIPIADRQTYLIRSAKSA